MGLEVGVWAMRLGFWPQDWDMALEAEIWAQRWGGGMKKKKEEKIPHV